MFRAPLLALPAACLATLCRAEAAPVPFGGAEILCRPAIVAAERSHALPPGLMAAIGRVESGRRDPQSGTTNPWPWTINAEGAGAFFASKAEAIAAVRALQARGVRSIDVGCMQVNLLHHPDAFPNLEAAFDPSINADYAARFLTELFGQTHAWPDAAGRYHSATPELRDAYQRRVMAVWSEEGSAQFAASAASPLARAWASTLGGGASAGGFRLPMAHSAGGHIIPLVSTPGRPAPPGRDLAAYRAAPIFLAARPAPAPAAARAPSASREFGANRGGLFSNRRYGSQ